MQKQPHFALTYFCITLTTWHQLICHINNHVPSLQGNEKEQKYKRLTQHLECSGWLPGQSHERPDQAIVASIAWLYQNTVTGYIQVLTKCFNSSFSAKNVRVMLHLPGHLLMFASERLFICNQHIGVLMYAYDALFHVCFSGFDMRRTPVAWCLCVCLHEYLSYGLRV